MTTSTQGTRAPGATPPNAQRRWLTVCWLVVAGGLVMVALPALGLVDIFAGGGAMLMIGIWLAASAFVLSFMARSRMRAHDLIVGAGAANADRQLAHWTYEPGPWLEHVNRDYAEERAGKWALWRVVAFFCITIGGAFWYAEPDDAGPVVALVLLGLLGVLAMVVHFSTTAALRHHGRGPGEVYIGLDGVWYNGALHVWRGWGCRIEEVTYPGPAGNLVVTYSAPARYGRQSQEVRIPVPAGAEAEAQSVAETLAGLLEPA